MIAKEKKWNLSKYQKKNVLSRPTFRCRSDGNVFGLIFDHFQVRNGRLMSKNGIFLHFFTFGPITNDHFWSNLIIIWKISISHYFNYFLVFNRLIFRCRSDGSTLNIICFPFLASKWPFKNPKYAFFASKNAFMIKNDHNMKKKYFSKFQFSIFFPGPVCQWRSDGHLFFYILFQFWPQNGRF